MAPRSWTGGWDGWPPPSRPLAADGIRARRQRGDIGTTWWSKRFIAVLESFNMGARLQRGRRYARAGQVLDLEVGPGRVTAAVQGSRPKPYRVLIGLEVLSEADWARAEAAMSAKAVFAAKLLAAEMPHEIEAVFAACRLSLFPRAPSDLDTACSCPDWANPCKHVAATYYLLAEAFDDDPFLILAWRGRDRSTLLDHLRFRRGATDRDDACTTAEEGWAAVGDVVAEPIAATDRFWRSGPELNGVVPRLRAAASPGAILRQAEPVDITVRGRGLVEVLDPAYDRITTGVLGAAVGEDGTRS